MTRKELRDRQDKYDAFWAKKGQEEAKRYLKSKEQAQPTGRIREIIASIAFLILAFAVIFIGMAL